MIRQLILIKLIWTLQAGAADARSIPTPEVGVERGQSSFTTLTLEQAVAMALENNLDLLVARLDVQAQTEGIFVARGAYTPRFSTVFDKNDTEAPTASQLSGADTLTSDVASFTYGWQQLLATGGDYRIEFLHTRTETNSAFSSINPRFDSFLRLQATQPLVKNRALNPVRQQIVVARNGERAARHLLEARVMDVVRDVQVAYWDLVSSNRQLEVAEKSLELARELLRNNRIQVEVGVMAPLDVLEAEAEVAAREEAVILAQEAIERDQDVLKRLIREPDAPDFWSREIRTVDQPLDLLVEVDPESSMATALERRPELSQERTELDTRGFDVRYRRNQTRPQIDAVASLRLNGLGGDRLLREGFGSNQVTSIVPGGLGNALDQVFGADFQDLRFGLSLTYPLGHGAEDAAYARARVEHRRQRARIANLEILVVQEVRGAARQVEASFKRIEVTRVARELAQKRLEAEEKKFEVGMSTSFLIVQAQRDLTQAEANELTALIDYNKSLVELERARGTILDPLRISVR